ncbi:MAG: hypothetical protein H6810_01400 [Phycisphaeraceae bacterium]|nr:MAG: hypothetical protein H6810_01400 [Phycisphaeraceae bacterium]
MAEDRARADKVRASMSRFGLMGYVPPPPAGHSLASRQLLPDEGASYDADATADRGAAATPGGPVYPFDAELEMAEVDERGKLGTPWSARSRTLSRGSLTVTSRRMCYPGRRVLVAIHRVDDEPMVLLGRVVDCAYESDGLYLLELELLPMNDGQTQQSFSRRAGA